MQKGRICILRDPSYGSKLGSAQPSPGVPSCSQPQGSPQTPQHPNGTTGSFFKFFFKRKDLPSCLFLSFSWSRVGCLLQLTLGPSPRCTFLPGKHKGELQLLPRRSGNSLINAGSSLEMKEALCAFAYLFTVLI